MTIDGERLIVDFEGTSPAVRGNINCPLAVTQSACLFALRVLLPHDIPTNAGSAAVLEVRAPEGSLVHARRPSAVVAGNVETGQRLADTVLAALGQVVELPAAGQGTMNNLIIGGDDWTYYETIGGGQGASVKGPGPSGVHVGMSNTLNTPVESLELEFPLRVQRYELRYGSGGDGANRGGDGIDRVIEVLEPATVCVLADRRRHGPAGKEGGEPGAPRPDPARRRGAPAEGHLPRAARRRGDGADARRGRLWSRSMSADPFDGLRIDQSSTAERVSDAIRDLIVQGELLGGQPLREHSLREALGVSRNTVREALRLLSRERLVVYHLHKGVAVRRISAEDVREIFRTREPIEVIAIEYSRQAPPEALKALLAPGRGGRGRGQERATGRPWPPRTCTSTSRSSTSSAPSGSARSSAAWPPSCGWRSPGSSTRRRSSRRSCRATGCSPS